VEGTAKKEAVKSKRREVFTIRQDKQKEEQLARDIERQAIHTSGEGLED
jgi:hypothetical protein